MMAVEAGVRENIEAQVLAIYGRKATKRYGLSQVNQLLHGLQAATLAERQGEPPSLIVAALLHDAGHMVHDLGENPADRGVDDFHERLGADWLARYFEPEVVEPVRLHVAAKRYLCATESGYFGRLSPDSVLSLTLQGGPMSEAEVEAFDALPFASGAVRLRRFDEAAKDPAMATSSLEYFLRYFAARGVQLPG